MRKLAYIVTVDSISPIAKADAIEVARVGGWSMVVKKGEFNPGDRAVYIEIDAFLPDGNPAWQFLVDKQGIEHAGIRGHVLRTVVMRKQVSQGLLVQIPMFGDLLTASAIGEDVSALLGIQKYEKPIPKELEGLARGMYPSCIPKTDQERIQNLPSELAIWQKETSEWEVTEKMEGASVTYAWFGHDFHACSRTVDYLDLPNNNMWQIAHRLNLPTRFEKILAGRNLAIQGEMVGPGIEDNIYKLSEYKFYAYDIYDLDNACYLGARERHALVAQLGVDHAPVVFASWTLRANVDMDVILSMAVGPSTLLSAQTREGLVYKKLDGTHSFKAISNEYLKKKV